MDSTTLLLRQIHPSFVQDGRVTSQAFRPTPKDQGKLSIYDGDQIDPEPSWQHYTQEVGNDSVGVMGLLGSECDSLDLLYALTEVPYPQHGEIDFNHLNPTHRVKISKKLKAKAVARNWLFRAPVELEQAEEE